MSKEIEDKIKEGIINSAPDKEGADWVKSAIDSGRIIIMSECLTISAYHL